MAPLELFNLGLMGSHPSDGPTKRGHLSILLDANLNSWERRWFVLRRYILH